MRLVPQPGDAPPDVRDEVWGEEISAACSPVYTRSVRRLRRAVVRDVRVWPEGGRELTYTFPRDISGRVKWCLLEKDGGTDVAAADFGIFIRIYASNAADRRAGQALRRHLLQRAATRPWVRRIRALVVDRGMIALTTDLRRYRRGRQIAKALCTPVRESGTAADPSGHAVYGRNDARLRPC